MDFKHVMPTGDTDIGSLLACMHWSSVAWLKSKSVNMINHSINHH